MSLTLQGRGVSDGLCMAEVLLFSKEKLCAPDVPARPPEEELACFEAAAARTRDRLQRFYNEASEKLGGKEAEIFDAHLTMLQDEYSVAEPIRQAIREEGLSAAKAVERQFDTLAELFESLNDELMAARAADARDLKEQLLRAVLGVPEQDISRLDRNVILLAEELVPSDTVKMDTGHVVGLATHIGGITSHTAIIARTLGIPAVVGLSGWEGLEAGGKRAILDGTAGTLTLEPTAEEAAAFARKKKQTEQAERELAEYRRRPSAPRDGVPVELCANIGTPEEAKTATSFGAEGVGLFRSEFLFMDRDTLPGEEEQFAAYRQALEAMAGKPVIVRTLDVGGDKKLPALDLPREDNPFLGYRAIRMTLKHPELFRTQLRALLRAAAYGDLRIMFPMISGARELRAAKTMLEQARAELTGRGVPAGRVRVGMMVEIPAAALMADQLAREADFFSIGTNDLIQYTLAVERGNENVAELYTPYHPAVLRLIAATARAAAEHHIPCGMCGEAAGDAKLAPALVGMGVRELSMSPRLIPRIRRLLSGLTLAECEGRARKLLEQPDEESVRRCVEGAQV